jgi:hypothetical protein
MSKANDPLDDFLREPPALAIDDSRKKAVFEQTRLLLTRRAGGRWPLAIGVAAAIALAFVSGYFVARSQYQAVLSVPDLVERDVPEAPEIAPEPQIVQAPPNPRALEWSAFDADHDRDRVRLYFQAGDLYLNQQNDVQSALRCYQQAIHYCDASELEIDASDNWLVLALKRDHRKEK